MGKLWEKGIKADKDVVSFTVGKDYTLDQRLVEYDCYGSIAHAEMLNKIGVINDNEKDSIVNILREIIELSKGGKFKISPEDEDCHTKIENYLTRKLGKTGEKIHTARSRNDQVITALRLYYKNELSKIKELAESLSDSLKSLSGEFGDVKIPGFTHTRKAMVTNIEVWCGCFMEGLSDDIDMIDAVIHMIDQCPLGTGAGFGIPVLKIDRELTKQMLHFERIQNNPIYVQNSRGKFEGEIASVLSMILLDVNKFASDVIIFSEDDIKIITIPDKFTTGSSMMPQKKNPDVFEIARANYAKVISLEVRLKMLPANLISGYHRDLQLTKEAIFEVFDITKNTLSVMSKVVKELKINRENAEKFVTEELFATQKAYELVEKGIPFREAYRIVSKSYNK